MSTKQILRNTFHRTVFKTSLTPAEIQRRVDQYGRWDQPEADRAWVRRVKRTLCPSPGCVCSGPLGTRERD